MAYAKRGSDPGFQSLRKELAGETYRPVYVLAGDNTKRSTDIVDYIRRKALGDAGSAFNYHVYDAEDVGLDRIIQQAISFPMMCDRQLLWVKRCDQAVHDAESEAGLIRYLESPAKETILVFMSEKVDGRKNWVKIAKKLGYYVDMATPTGQDLVDWVQRAARDKGVPLGQSATALLVELVGDDIHALENELDKLALIAESHQGRITDAVLAEFIMQQRSVDPFELIKEIGPGQLRTGLRLLNRYLAEGRSPYELAPLLIWRVKQVAQVAALLAEGHPERSLPSLMGASPFAVKQAAETVRRWGPETVAQALKSCYHCERDMKSSPLGAEAVLEKAILEICA